MSVERKGKEKEKKKNGGGGIQKRTGGIEGIFTKGVVIYQKWRL